MEYYEVINHIFVGLLGFFSFILAVLLRIKQKTRRTSDFTIIAEIIPLIYIAISTLFYLLPIISFPVFFVHFGVLLLYISFIAVTISKILRFKYDKSIKLDEQILILKNLEERFFNTLENAQVGFFIVNNKGDFEYVNPKFVEISQWRRSELLEMNFNDLCINNKDDLLKVKDHNEHRNFGEKLTTDCVDFLKRKYDPPILVRAIATTSNNGHPTIVGSISIMEEGNGN